MKTTTKIFSADAIMAERLATLDLTNVDKVRMRVLRQLYSEELTRRFNLDEKQAKFLVAANKLSLPEQEEWLLELARGAGADIFTRITSQARTTNMFVRIARYYNLRIREVGEWVPEGTQPIELVTSLQRHLFAKYPVPFFIQHLWESGRDDRMRNWYIHIAQGGSFYTMKNVPLKVTHRMAHFLAQAPQGLNAPNVFRWAQIRAMGGSDELALLLARTFLGEVTKEEAFWEPVVALFARSHPIAATQVTAVLDYIQYQKYGYIGVVPMRTAVPPDPAFSVKGRTLASLERLTREWHRQLGGQRPTQYMLAHVLVKWKESGIPGYTEELTAANGEKAKVELVELLNGADLVAEGQNMHHCVGTYTHACTSGQSGIWSLRQVTGEGFNRVLTLEVNLPSRTIVQVRGVSNARPGPELLDLLIRWGGKANLKMAPMAAGYQYPPANAAQFARDIENAIAQQRAVRNHEKADEAIGGGVFAVVVFIILILLRTGMIGGNERRTIYTPKSYEFLKVPHITMPDTAAINAILRGISPEGTKSNDGWGTIHHVPTGKEELRGTPQGETPGNESTSKDPR